MRLSQAYSVDVLDPISVKSSQDILPLGQMAGEHSIDQSVSGVVSE